MRIIDTDNYGGDYPDEKFLEPLPLMPESLAREIADFLNARLNSTHSPRYYVVVDNDYALRPGFEP